MPISAIDGCGPEHWAEVLKIVKESCDKAGFSSSLVSDSEDSGIIQKRIVTNVYKSDIVIVDVSAKNPNVMFELGMRLAFDKPAIIIKDDKTGYSFDTGVIEHLAYPRDLHYYSILDFKDKLVAKLSATHKAATTDPNYTTFLKHFGEYTVKGLESTEVGGNEYVLKAVEELREELALTRRRSLRHEFLDASSAELGEVAGFFIDQFRREKKIPRTKLFEHSEELYEYLENQDILRRLATSPDRLRKAMEEGLLRAVDGPGKRMEILG